MTKRETQTESELRDFEAAMIGVDRLRNYRPAGGEKGHHG